ncbi:MAG: hypothetical protein ACTSQQ_17705 [Candidatus Helarchaeota archaeon]
MVYLNLNYFNTIQGPQIFQTYPEDADENIVQSVANLLNISELIKQKFFVYEGADFKTVSLYFEIPSEWARGKKEMLLLSIILPPEASIENKGPIRVLLEKVESEINTVEKGFMGFYEYDYSKFEEFEDEIENTAKILRKILENYSKDAENVIKEARRISIEQLKEIYEQKALGFYVVDDEFLNYLFELEQDKTPFVRFSDFIESGISVFSSEECLAEFQADEPIREIVRDYVGIKDISQEEIDILKQGVDPRRLPSDAKISLIALIKYLREMNPDFDITIVSPNREYLRFIQDYFPDLMSLPPSSFFLEIINNLENRAGREYFEKLRKRLIAISVASQTIIPVSSAEACEVVAEPGFEPEELALINKFIAGEPISTTQLILIKDYIEFLKGIKNAQVALRQIQEEMNRDEFLSAQAKIFLSIKNLNDSFLLSSASISEREKRHQIQILLANFIANFQFLAAISYLNRSQLEPSIEQFGLAATFSAIAGQEKKVLISNYLKSITCLYNDSYDEAIHHFTITSNLGAKYHFPGYQIMCLAGKAISELLAGQPVFAYRTIEAVRKLISNNEQDVLVMFEEFGDNFYMKGKPEIAIHLYNEALEVAILLDAQKAVSSIFNKLKRSFYAVGAYNTPLSTELHNLISKAHLLKDPDTIDKYNLQIAKLGTINQLIFEPFPYITKDWISGAQLPKELLEPFDLLHYVVESKFIQIQGKRQKFTYTNLYCYKEELGGIIIRVPGALELKIKDVPLIYKIALNPNDSKFKIIDSSTEDKQFFYSRAIIQTTEKKNLNIKRILPEIFGEFFED